MLSSVVAVAVLSVVSGGFTSQARCPGLGARIPPAVHPDTYALFLHPRLLEGAFTGHVSIAFNISEPLKCLPVHVNGLTVTRTELTGPTGVVALAGLHLVREFQYWILEFPEELPSGAYNVSISFSGSALNKMTGLYRSSYRLPGETQERYLMTTKFEPADARQAFPCFDEPQLKAKFTISVVRPEGPHFTALSNSKALREVLGPFSGEVTVEFQETPAMSTYLVAAVVSDLRDLGSVPVTSAGVELPLRVFAAPHLVNGTAYARRVGQEVLAYFITYFDIPFPLPKMDMIAIPDFISGAMENWGLITYRESRLLVSDSARSFAALRRIAHVIAHELSHQWFGNLVTMRWWEDLWLNEGFARFMEYKGVGALTENSTEGALARLEESPEVLDLKMSVMAKDGMLNSHPIVVKVSRPEEISEIFDVISYSKGASILMMIEQALGDDAFKAGVQKYLKTHAFGNAASADLWTALSQTTNTSLKESMATWTDQMGYPMINVHRVKNGAELTQKRFLNDMKGHWSPDSSPFRYRWDIPVCYQTSGANDGKMQWLNRRDKKLVITIPTTEPWVKFNCRGSAYYRVNYDLKSWAVLTDLLLTNHTALDPADRANLLDDAFALANAGYVDFSIPLRMAGYLTQERVRLPLAAGFSQLMGVKARLGLPHSPLVTFIRKLAQTVYDQLVSNYTWDFTKEQITKEEEFYALQIACKSGIKACRKPVSSYFQRWIKNETMIIPDLRNLVYSSGMKYAGTLQDWETVLKRYREERDPQEREFLMAALVSTRDETLVKRLLDDALKGSLVRPQDFFAVLARVGSAMSSLAWRWYQDHYPEMVRRFSLSDKGLGRALEAITARFRSRSKLHQLRAFVSRYPEGGAATMARKKAIEKVESNMHWLERSEGIARFFEQEKEKSMQKLSTKPSQRPKVSRKVTTSTTIPPPKKRKSGIGGKSRPKG